MAADLTISQGATTPALAQTITDASGNVVNLTGGTVTFLMRQLSSSALTVNAAATILSPSAGTVQYSWSATDTATAGMYMGQFHCVLSGGGTYDFPNAGYLEIEVQENLSLASQQLVTVANVKDVLNFDSTNRVHDTKILRWINAVRPVVEAITGPVIQQDFDEWYDGGQYWIMLRHTPSTGYGTSPVLILKFVSAYIGPIEYPFSLVNNPVVGSIYTAELDTYSRVVRRGPGGGIIPFPNMLQSVHIAYTAGQSSVPDNVAEATLELIRHNYQATAQALRGNRARGEEVEAPPVGFFVPGKVRELLAPNRRAPSVF